MRRLILLLGTHVLALAIGFAMGVYWLPILIEPAPASRSEIAAVESNAQFIGEFRRELLGSDFLHWAEGHLFVSSQEIAFSGEVSPGPDYQLYLSPVFVEDEGQFERHRDDMTHVADIEGFSDFLVRLPEGIEPGRYTTAVIWCEAFGEFISAAQYRH